MNTESYYKHSEKVRTDDLDWDLANRVGLSPEEVFALQYFSDIENQTIIYMRDLVGTKIGLDSEVVAFLSVWNYEEFFHGYALGQLLEACGHPLEADRIKRTRKVSKMSEKLEAMAAQGLSVIFSNQFPALYLSWGSVQEFSTVQSYERLRDITGNPVLSELCDRIAKQERRHFAWYYNHAEKWLMDSRFSQRFTRYFLERFWTPVGAGVKDPASVWQMLASLFPGELGSELARQVDSKIGRLPGLEGVELFRPYFARAQKTRSTPIPIGRVESRLMSQERSSQAQ